MKSNPGLSINLGVINRLEKSVEKANINFKMKVNADNGVAVIPFQVVSGTSILSERGEYGSNEDLNQFNMKKVLWDGRENIVLLAKGWGRLQGYLDDGTVVNNNADYYVKVWKEIPEFYVGIMNSHSKANMISDSNIFNDIKQTQNEDTISIVFYEFQVDDNYLQYFYKIPTEGNSWYRIQNADVLYDEGVKYATIITFVCVNDELSSSGVAIDQYFHEGAPGEGFPKYNQVIRDKSVVVEADTIHPVDTPITSVQIEILGSGILHSLNVLGREYKKDIPDRIDATYLLWFSRFLTPQPTNITKKSLPTSNFYMFLNGYPSQRINFDGMEEKWASYYDETTRPDTQGYFMIEKSSDADDKGVLDTLRKSSGVIAMAGGAYVPDGKPIPDTNPLPTFTNRGKIWDDLDQPISKQSNGVLRYWVDSNAMLKTTKAVYDKTDQYTYIEINDGATAKNHDLLPFFGLVLWDTYELPLDLTTITPFSFQDLPVIGALFNLIGVGKIPLYVDSSTWSPNKFVPGFIPSTTAEFCGQYFGVATGGFNVEERLPIPYGILRSDTEDTSYPLVGTKSQNTTFRLALTDEVQDRKDTTIASMIDLGQPIDPTDLSKGYKLQMGIDTHTGIPTSKLGFIIDSLILKASAKCNYRVSFFFDEGEGVKPTPVWNGRFQTQSKWNGNDRSITNCVNFTPWAKNLNTSASFKYPAPILPELPPNLDYSFIPYQVPWVNSEDTLVATVVSNDPVKDEMETTAELKPNSMNIKSNLAQSNPAIDIKLTSTFFKQVDFELSIDYNFPFNNYTIPPGKTVFQSQPAPFQQFLIPDDYPRPIENTIRTFPIPLSGGLVDLDLYKFNIQVNPKVRLTGGNTPAGTEETTIPQTIEAVVKFSIDEDFNLTFKTTYTEIYNWKDPAGFGQFGWVASLFSFPTTFNVNSNNYIQVGIINADRLPFLDEMLKGYLAKIASTIKLVKK